MPDYRERLLKMMEELKADPTVDGIVAKVGEPADDCSIEELEEGQGAQIHPELLSFYRSCGGVQLLWYTVGDPAVDPDEARDLAGAFRAMDDVAIVERMNQLAFGLHRYNGAINIPPIEAMGDLPDHRGYAAGSARYTIDFGGTPYPAQEFFASIKVFDFYHHYTYAGMVFATAADKALLQPLVGLGDDHGACWTDYSPISFSGYLDMIIATFGAVKGRKVALDKGRGGGKNPPLARPEGYWRSLGVRPSDVGTEAGLTQLARRLSTP
jgi:hypothetical protein